MNTVPLLMSKEVLGKLSAINVALLCFAFPITSVVPLFLNIDSFLFNYLLRVMYLLLSTYLLVGAFHHRATRKLSLGAWFLIIFWMIYSLRIFYDVHVQGVIFRDDLLKLYGFAFGNCLIGALATLATIRFASPGYLKRVIIGMISIGCVGILAGVVFQYQTLNPVDFLGRARFTIDNGTERGQDVLNPITISLTGQLMVVVNAYRGLLDKPSVKRFLWSSVGVVIGGLVLVLGGSRGPFLGTAISLLLIVGISVYNARKTTLNLLKIFFLIGGSCAGLFYYLYSHLENSNLLVLKRLQSLNEGGGKEVRSYQWESAIEQFTSSPILGDRYLERAFNFYPHNVYLEALMATGLVGSFWFFGMLGLLLWGFYNDVRTNSHRILYGIILFAILLSVFTSGSLFQSVILWGGLGLYFGLSRSRVSSCAAE